MMDNEARGVRGQPVAEPRRERLVDTAERQEAGGGRCVAAALPPSVACLTPPREVVRCPQFSSRLCGDGMTLPAAP